MTTLQPVILSGGSGTRLWPLSRRLYPKQFMDIGGTTLFGTTLTRVQALPSVFPPIVICNEEQRFLAAAILHQLGFMEDTAGKDKAAILLEPEGRNTAPAIALSAFCALEKARRTDKEADPLLLVLSSDHIINPQEELTEAVQRAAPGALAGKLVVFGVTPDRPETGFGYIRPGKELLPDIFTVDGFIEKPDWESANTMVNQGGFFWNSGMFLFTATTILKELEQYAPALYTACENIWSTRSDDLSFTRFSTDVFKACPSDSIDYAVMEHTDKACITPLGADWHDLGSWQAVYEVTAKDFEGNAIHGDVIHQDTKNCYLHSSNRLVAAVGLEEITVVETADAVLVIPRERSQEVKQLLEQLKLDNRPETDTHVRVYRPWGSYEILVLGDRFQVKRLIVSPGCILSLQLHHQRSEHWVVVKGTANVVLGDDNFVLKEDESVYIPLGMKHRLENTGNIPLEIIEIQTGTYLGEDDIVRFEDTYGRII